MNLPGRTSLAFLAAAASAVLLGGCRKPAATPGEKIDRAIDRTGDALKTAGEAIKRR